MKLLPPVIVPLLLAVYWLMTILSRRIITSWMKDHRPARVTAIHRLFWGEALLVTLLFLFFYGLRPDQSSPCYYFFHTLFNALLITDLLGKLPLAAASMVTLFNLKPRSERVIVRMGLIWSAGLMLLILTGMVYGMTSWSVRKQTLVCPDLPASFDGLRIVHFSDAHLGSFRNTKLLRKFTYVTQSFRPDLVCFTGDLVNNYGSEPVKYRNELKQMAAGEGNYAILGNHDYGDYTKWPDSLFKSANFQDITEAFRTSGFRLLLNDSAMLTRGGDTLYITGFSYPGHQPLFHKTAIEQVVNRLPAHCFCIALCHDPELWTTSLSRDSRFGLTLSGHTHGLQWGYYPAGIALSMARLVRKNWAGHYRKGNSHLYVNRGTGVVGMFFRIDMPAEITLLTLKRVEVD